MPAQRSRSGNSIGKNPISKSRDTIVSNTFGQIDSSNGSARAVARVLTSANDVGHLYTLAHYLDRKLLEPPVFVQTIFGVMGGIGARIRKISCTCAAPPIGCLALTINGPSWQQDGTR